jgi:hypothetical protein
VEITTLNEADLETISGGDGSGFGTHDPVGAEYSATLCDLGVFMDQPAESISPDGLDVGIGRVG